MQFTTNSKQLLSALTAVGRVVPAKTSIQILTHFLVEVNDGEVVITGSDVENRAAVKVQADTDGNGKFCVEAKFLANVVKSLPDCQVAVDVADNYEMRIRTERNTFTASVINAKDYPDSDFHEQAIADFELPTDTLLSGFGETSFAVGDDDFRPQMMGVCVDVKPDQVIFVATDTRRLVKSVRQVQTDCESRCIVSSKALSVLGAIAAKTPNIRVGVYSTAVVFEGESFTLRCQLIKGAYPPYDRVIPQNNHISAIFNRSALLSAVNRVATCAETHSGALRFSFDNDRTVISSSDTNYGREAKETVDCDFGGAPLVLGLSAALISGLLSAVPTENVELRMADSSHPVLVLPVGDDQHLTTLLMPLNINTVQ